MIMINSARVGVYFASKSKSLSCCLMMHTTTVCSAASVVYKLRYDHDDRRTRLVLLARIATDMVLVLLFML